MLGKEKFKYNLASIMVIPKTSRAFLSKDLENWQPAFRNEHRINLSYLQKIAAYNRKTDTECSPSDMSKLKKKRRRKKRTNLYVYQYCCKYGFVKPGFISVKPMVYNSILRLPSSSLIT